MPTQSEISLNPTSTKGEILTSNGSSRIGIAVGTSESFILTARSSTSSGLSWEARSGGSQAFYLISSATITANTATVSFENLDLNSYDHLKLHVAVAPSSTYGLSQISFNNDVNIVGTRLLLRSQTGVESRSINSPATTTKFRPSSYGVSDSEVLTQISYDIFLENKTAGRTPFHGYYIALKEATSWTSGSNYDSEIVFFAGSIAISVSSLSSIHLTMDAYNYASGSVIKLYGLKGQ